jgi:hypothetical protein
VDILILMSENPTSDGDRLEGVHTGSYGAAAAAMVGVPRRPTDKQSVNYSLASSSMDRQSLNSHGWQNSGKRVRTGGSLMSTPKVNASIGKYRQLVLTLHCLLMTNPLSVTYRIGVFINCVRGRP